MEKKARDRRPRHNAGSAAEPARAKTERQPAAALSGSLYWITTQGHEVTIHSGTERPNTTPEPEARTIAVEGPYKDEATAERRASFLRSRSPMYKGSSTEVIR